MFTEDKTAISELIKRHSRGQRGGGGGACLVATSPEDAGHAGSGDKLRQHPCCAPHARLLLCF